MLSRVSDFIDEWGECLTDSELKQFRIDLEDALECLK
jgi:hypothetical protein